MHLAYATTFDARDVHNWSGTPCHMAQAFTSAGAQVSYIGSLKRKLPKGFKIKQALKHWLVHQRDSPRFNEVAAQHYSYQVAQALQQISVDAVISPLINPIAYLECKAPIVLWTDAVYAALVGFYPTFMQHSASSVKQGNAITAACLARTNLAIFSSDWAARNALELYGMSKDKVKVVPFGANIHAYPDSSTICEIIQRRVKQPIKLLFLAKSWERKGGDMALSVAHALHEAGYAVELSIAGCSPSHPVPSYVKLLGFISKQTDSGRRAFWQLLCDSHFLILPSRADACPMVFAEANAFGLPCLTTYVGGISTAVRDDINGKTFAVDASPKLYCDYITEVMHTPKRYAALALAAHHEYETRLNWGASVAEVKRLISEI